MFISKTKSYTNLFSLNEIKEDLRIVESDNQYNNELNRLIKTAVSVAEKFIDNDIVPTVNVLEDYYFHGCVYQINQPSITITSISADGNPVTGYTVFKYNQFTQIKFKSAISCDKIIINYNSGSSTIDPHIYKAISIKVAELFDVDRNNYVNGSIRESKSFERLLYPFKNHIYN